MQVSTHVYRADQGWDRQPPREWDSENTLLLVFAEAGRSAGWVPGVLAELAGAFPASAIMGCSTAGEIRDDKLHDQSLVLALMRFEHSRLRLVNEAIPAMEASGGVGEKVAGRLAGPGLRAVFTLTDGLRLNGSAYVAGIGRILGSGVVVTGGMAADGERFQDTWVLVDGEPRAGMVSACGLYGDRVVVSHGSRGGWDQLGIDRRVTRAENNVLYSLDDRPALALYKEYLGEMAAELPGSALLFPLAIKDAGAGDMVVRTVLAVDEQTQSITFAGDVPEGATVCLMRANFERLIDAAGQAVDMLEPDDGGLCVAISCVGRRMVLGVRAEEELEAVLESLPAGTPLVGFYSYGEISPVAGVGCSLHNQTMTLTLFQER